MSSRAREARAAQSPAPRPREVSPSAEPSDPCRASTRTLRAESTVSLPAVSGAEFVVQELERQGVEVLVGIPGGAILPLYDALGASRLRHVLARHEQGAGFIAQGLARVSGKPAVCLATSGPGVTNLITALADARADSVPLVAITAQVPRALIGSDAFQEVDTCALARPVTKASFFVSSPVELRRILPQAFELARSGRPGPVLVDIPKDLFSSVGGEEATPTELAGGANGGERPAPAEPPSARVRPGAERLLDASLPETWEEVARLLSESARPLFYIGGGIHASGAHAELAALAERADVPVVSSLHGLGAFPGDDPRFLGMLGMHGAPYTNHATDAADLVIAVGARFDDRATGRPEQFCRNARIVHLDVDPREIGKIKPVAIGIVADARRALAALLEVTPELHHPEWRAQIERLRAAHPLMLAGSACRLLTELDRRLGPDTIVTTDVGQHQMWVAQCLRFRRPRTLLTSGGLGTMGFGVPAAIGAALARPGAQIVCVTGDGSCLMNLQELATLAELDLNVAVLVLNNGQLGLVRQQQQLFYGRRYSAAHFERGHDFAALASAFGIRAGRADAAELHGEELESWLRPAGPCLIDVRIGSNENVLPMVPPGASNLEMILSAG